MDRFETPPAQADALSPPGRQTRQHGWRQRLTGRDAGATGVEYALLACFVALAILIGTGLAGNSLNGMFYVVGNKVGTAADAAKQNSN